MIGLVRTRHAVIVHVIVFAISALVIWKKGFLEMEGLQEAVRKDDESTD